MIIKESFINDRPNKKLKKIKGIIVHWTANTRSGAGANAHLNYFKNNWKIGCTHYVVDDKEIIYLIPESIISYESAWSLFEKHNLTVDNVHRHFDISGKDCPFMYQPQLVNERYFDWSWITFKEFIKAK